MAATEAQLQQGILDTQGRRVAWNRVLDAIQQDADALSLRSRSRHLPPANGLGQLPLADVRVDRRVGGQELGDIQTTIIPATDVPWQNLANKIADTRQRGLDELGAFEDRLNGQLAALRQQLAAAGPTAPSEQPGKDPRKLAPWIDFLASLVSWVIVFWGFVIIAQSLNFFNWLVVAAFVALTFVLRGVLINPVKQVVLTIFGAIIQILNDLVNFVVEWFNGILQYFQGDFLRAILQILEVAAFMYLWSFAQRIPVIGNLIKLITQAVGAVVNWINQTFDTVIKFLEFVRKQAEQTIGLLFDSTTSLGKLLAGAFNQQIDRLIGGLEGKLQTLRFELLDKVDIVRQFTQATITVFGFRLQLVPDEVRAYLLNRTKANPFLALSEYGEVYALAPSATPATVPAPFGAWDQLREDLQDLVFAFKGLAVEEAATATEFITELQAVQSGTPPSLPDWPPDLFVPPSIGPIPPVGGPPGSRPSYISGAEWAQVVAACPAEHLALLIGAIGWQETHWGRTGRGPDGYILGVGVLDTGTLTEFQGLSRQLGWECPRLITAFPTPGAVSQAALTVYARDVRHTTAYTSWGAGVYAQYLALIIATGGGIVP